jgi:anti-anti-sigma factor
MNIVTETIDAVCVLRLAGQLDPLATEQLQAVVDAQLRAERQLFLFDCTELTYIGSVSLRVFVSLSKRVHHIGKVALFGVSPMVRQVFDITKVSQAVKIYATQGDALDAFKT